MTLTGRKKEIFDILCVKQRMSVSELSKMLFVSEMTIRRDLAEMEKQGFLRRYRGGAIINQEINEMPVYQRMFCKEEEKKQLSKKVEKYLSNNMNVYIDSSSTCQFIIPHIKKYDNIKIITNSVQTLLNAAKLHIPCFVIGGEYFEQDMCFVGSVAEKSAEKINADIAFFSTRGLSDDGVISDSDIKQTMVRYIIMQNAKKNIFLFENTKLGKKFLHTLCYKDNADDIIVID